MSEAGGDGGRLVGRDREIATFRRAVHAAKEDRRGQVILLEAPAGCGKTTLAEEFGRQASGEEVSTFWGRCWDVGGAPPFWPWVRVLRDVVATDEGEAALAALGGAARHVRDLLGETEAGDPAEASSEQARFAMFDAVGRLLQRVSSVRPILLVLDDLHSADVGSLRLLQFVARELRTAPALVVGTYRPAEAKLGDVLDILSEVAGEGTVMHLAGLEASDLAIALESSVGIPVSPALLKTLHDVTDGNPFFAREILRMLEVEGHVRLDAATQVDLALPPRVSHAILRRVEPLAQTVRDNLDRAAVIGREFDVTMLAAAGDMRVVDVMESLSDAVRHDVVREGATGQFAFSHAVVREALYEAIPPIRRAELHTATAEALEQRSGRRVEVAYHLRAGVAVAGARRAFTAMLAAIDEAIGAFAFEDAVALSGAALELADAAGASSHERVEVLVARGRAQVRAGALDDAPGSFLQAAQVARAAEWPEGVARAAVAYADAPVVGGVTDAQLVQLLEDAARRLPDDDSELRAIVLARLAHAQIFDPDVERRIALIEAAIDMGRRVASPRALASVFEASLAVLLNARLDEEALALADEAVALSRALGDAELEVMLRARRASWLLDLRPVRAFNDEVDAIRRLAQDMGYPLARWMAVMLSFTQAMLAGDLDRCDALAEEGAGLPNPNSTGALMVQTVALRLHRGTLTQQDVDAARFVAMARPGIAFTWEAIACPMAALIGNLDDARTLLHRLVAAAADQPRDQRFPTALGYLTEAASFLDDSEAAAELYRLLGEFAGRQVFTAMVTPVAYWGPTELYLGIAARVRGDVATAERHLRDAAASAGRIGAQIAVAEARLELARVLVAMDRPEEALQQAEDVLPFAERVGLPGIAESARALVAGVLPDRPEVTQPLTSPRQPSMVLEGEYWSITFGGTVSRVRDTKAVRHLAILLEHPDTEFAAIDLVSAVEGNTRGGGEAGVPTGGGTTVWAALDTRAKAEYRRRLEELAAEVEDAEALGNDLAAEKARSEMEFIARELSGAVGLGGRDRATGPEEQARVAVTKLLKRLVQRLGNIDAALGAHLRSTVRTGMYCGYMSHIQPTLVWEIQT